MDNRQDERRVAVTGSTGLVGSHLVCELVRAGYTGIVLPVRSRSRIDNLRRTFNRVGIAWPADGILSIVETSFADPSTLAGVFRGVDTVFNCAAVVTTGQLTAQELVENNVTVARSVAQAAAMAGVGRIIHTSSIIVLAPNRDRTQPITESNPSHDGSEGASYARSKYLSDLEIRRAASAGGIGLTILYPAVVLGEGDWSMSGSSALTRVIASGLPLYTEGVMAYADVRDVARACVAVDGCPAAAGQDFIVAGANLSFRELIALGARAAGKREPFIRAGRGLAMCVYRMIRLATALRLMKDKNVRKSNIDSVLYGNRYSGERLAEECGFRYTPIEETIDRIVKSYLGEKG